MKAEKKENALSKPLTGEVLQTPEEKEKEKKKRKFYDFVLLAGYLVCFIPAVLPQLTALVSVFLLACIAISFFDENFYIYAAIFMYMRYQLLIGDSPAFRIYSYLVVLKFATEILKIKFKPIYFPLLFVVILHSLYALPAIVVEQTPGATSMYGYRMGLNVIVDCVLVYIIMLRITKDDDILRKFMFVFMSCCLISEFNSLFNPELTVDINISGAGSHEVSRSFGLLSDANFAGLYYGLAFMCAVTMKGLPAWLRPIMAFLLLVMILKTASLSAILVLILFLSFYIILKFRFKSIFVLTAAFIAVTVALILLLSIPQFEKIKMIAGLIIRIKEKLSYIPRHRWDLLTTNRTRIWTDSIAVIKNSSLWQKLVGGRVITVVATEDALPHRACHNSYIQGVLNFGVIGTLMVYLPFFAVFAKRILSHFKRPSGYEGEDMRIMQMLFSFGFAVFGATVDCFVDWPLMLFYFL